MTPLNQHLTEELKAIIDAIDEDNPSRAHWLARTAINHIAEAQSPACHAPTGNDGNPATPPLHELRIMLNAAAYWVDNEPDEDHPDPMDEVCDLVRDANDLFNRIFPETPGQPIDIHAALANYDPTKEPTPWYRNHYICTECGTEWNDEHDCQCDDRCPKCNTSMQTHHSDDLTDD